MAESTLWWRRKRQSILSGPVCTIHIIVNMNNVEIEGEAWRSFRFAEDLKTNMLHAIHQVLGPEFDIRSMSLARGSIEIFVTIGAVYYAVSRYKNFVESIELLTKQLAGVVRRFFEERLPGPIVADVSSTWEPGSGLVGLAASDTPFSDAAWAYPLLWYVLLSHAPRPPCNRGPASAR
jgi:hypothetical protein